MTDLYDIHLFDRLTGAYRGTQNCQLGYDTEIYDATTLEPPATDKRGTDWWYPINWPYWSGNAWELRIVEE